MTYGSTGRRDLDWLLDALLEDDASDAEVTEDLEAMGVDVVRAQSQVKDLLARLEREALRAELDAAKARVDVEDTLDAVRARRLTDAELQAEIQRYGGALLNRDGSEFTRADLESLLADLIDAGSDDDGHDA